MRPSQLAFSVQVQVQYITDPDSDTRRELYMSVMTWAMLQDLGTSIHNTPKYYIVSTDFILYPYRPALMFFFPPFVSSPPAGLTPRETSLNDLTGE